MTIKRGDEIRHLSRVAVGGDVDEFRDELKAAVERIDNLGGKADLDDQLIYEAENLMRRGLIEEAVRRIQL